MSEAALPGSRIALCRNPRCAPAPADPGFAAGAAEAWAEITAWPGYAPTRLVGLDGLARSLGIAAIAWKDEGARFGLGSFKALGGAYAVLRVLQGAIAPRPSAEALRRGDHRDAAARVTVATATDGNHGRSVAWGAASFGARAVIYVPAACSAGREAAIARYGARLVRIAGDYDAAVAACAADARQNGWTVVADTSTDGDEEIPRLVTLGYAVMMAEAMDQVGNEGAPSHVFVQAGVGALAAAVAECLAMRYGAAAPRLVVVEPEGAACLFRSAALGHLAPAEPPVDSVMAGLVCGLPSPLAWPVLDRRAFAFATVEDRAVAPAMRLLAEAPFGDPPVVAGESAVAGLIALLAALADRTAASALGLGPASRVLLLGTEGATDPVLYEAMTGRKPG